MEMTDEGFRTILSHPRGNRSTKGVYWPPDWPESGLPRTQDLSFSILDPRLVAHRMRLACLSSFESALRFTSLSVVIG